MSRQRMAKLISKNKVKFIRYRLFEPIGKNKFSQLKFIALKLHKTKKNALEVFLVHSFL